jgi:4'-phosphopantetheinyl transferase
MYGKFTDVYISSIPKEIVITPLASEERNKEMAKVSNERLKREKYFVWKLLEYAISHSLGLVPQDVKFEKLDSGRWCTPEFEFSLSHTDGAAAVAVSSAPVGVDIEPVKAPRSKSFAEKILNESQFKEYLELSHTEREEYLIAKWTAKEAHFKSLHLSEFSPSADVGDAPQIQTDAVTLSGKKYILSVATENNVRIFSDVNL